MSNIELPDDYFYEVPEDLQVDTATVKSELPLVDAETGEPFELEILEPTEAELEVGVELPDVPWKDDLARIQDPEMMEMAIEHAKRQQAETVEKEKETDIPTLRRAAKPTYQHKPHGPHQSTRKQYQDKDTAPIWKLVGDLALEDDLEGGAYKDEREDISRIDSVRERLGKEAARDLAERLHKRGRISRKALAAIKRA